MLGQLNHLLPEFGLQRTEKGGKKAQHPHEKEAMEEEREGMNGWGRRNAEGQTDAPCNPELPWTTNGVHFRSSSPSFYPTISAQYVVTCRLGIRYTEMEKHTFTELTGNKLIYKET